MSWKTSRGVSSASYIIHSRPAPAGPGALTTLVFIGYALDMSTPMLMTLYITPVVYYYMDRLHTWTARTLTIGRYKNAEV